MKFIEKRSKSGARQLALSALMENTLEYLLGAFAKHGKLAFHFGPDTEKTS
ncbi:hypothetical protein [uncultured Kriegella sp.]|uniref:hypothetical protein n=1 Tax=uncultured Kriegella sp. TaxID=1798910 RepID=UPI0030DB771A